MQPSVLLEWPRNVIIIQRDTDTTTIIIIILSLWVVAKANYEGSHNWTVVTLTPSREQCGQLLPIYYTNTIPR